MFCVFRSKIRIKLIRNIVTLGIESSCDDTGVCIVDSNRVIYRNLLSSQYEIHNSFGGVVPLLAAREHTKNLPILVENAMIYSNLPDGINSIDAIAVTNGPGLPPCLKVGFNYAKSMSKELKKPLICLNHLESHLMINRFFNKDLEFPFLGMVLSGGHTLLLLCKGINDMELLGSTYDDAIGECYDKVARLLNLTPKPTKKTYDYVNLIQLNYTPPSPPSPPSSSSITTTTIQSNNQKLSNSIGRSGGSLVEEHSSLGRYDPKYQLPIPLLQEKSCNFSFSGIKTAVNYMVKNLDLNDENIVNNICFNFEKSVFAHLYRSTKFCIKMLREREDTKNINTMVISGGVICNNNLRKVIDEKWKNELEMRIIYPPKKEYCNDNGLMVAWNGIEHYLKKDFSDLETCNFYSRWSGLKNKNKKNRKI